MRWPIRLLFFCYVALTCFLFSSPPMLKPREPHWRPAVLETSPEGQPLRVLFYEQITETNETPVKQILFYPSGQVKNEADLIVVAEDSPGFQEWKSTIVPHGTNISFFQNGQIEKIAVYDRGLLNGEMELFHPDGKVKGKCGFFQGKRHGSMFFNHEDGSKAEEGSYEEGLLVGEVTRYFEGGAREALIPYVKGMPHGNALEWYPSGALKGSFRYQNGKLHSDGKTPALVLYAEDRSIIEAQDFNQGEPIGMHFKYHPNGKESYRVLYKDGKKQGKEQFFDSTGKVIGEGLYKDGVPVGKHYRNSEKGAPLFVASYDDQGTLLSPILEFSEEGQKLSEYFLKDGERDGHFCLWYPNGSPQVDYHYIEGSFEGEQREFFQDGKLKIRAFYVGNVKEGPYEEFYENGQIAARFQLKGGVKEGEVLEWYQDGKQKLQEHYKEGQLHGLRKEWYSNGVLKHQGEFVSGKKQGRHLEWNEGKELISEVSFDQDLPTGEVRVWYGKDQLKTVLHFSAGKRDGQEEEFYPNGKLRVRASYKDGLLDGEVSMWHEDGSLAGVKTYAAGLPKGEHKEFFSLTSLHQEPKVKSGGQVSRHFFYNPSGRMEGEQRTYYPSGRLHTVITYDDGELSGLKAMWDEEGNLLEEAHYINGKLTGRFFEKTRDGREVIYHYKNNRREGLHQVFFPSKEAFGKIKALEVNFVNHQAEGEALEYNEEGKSERVPL